MESFKEQVKPLSRTDKARLLGGALLAAPGVGLSVAGVIPNEGYGLWVDGALIVVALQAAKVAERALQNAVAVELNISTLSSEQK